MTVCIISSKISLVDSFSFFLPIGCPPPFYGLIIPHCKVVANNKYKIIPKLYKYLQKSSLKDGCFFHVRKRVVYGNGETAEAD
jgi:hypothetical protein